MAKAPTPLGLNDSSGIAQKRRGEPSQTPTLNEPCWAARNPSRTACTVRHSCGHTSETKNAIGLWYNRAKSRRSIGSIRRSPDSHLDTNAWVLRSALATCTWVSPESSRAWRSCLSIAL